MLSRISRRRRFGSLEDTDFVSESIGGNVGFESIASSDVDSLGKEFLDFGYDSCVVEQIYASLSVEVQQQINVAVRTLSPACRRTEQRQVFNTELLEARPGSTENIENSWNFLRAGSGRSRSRVSQDGAARDAGNAGRLKSRPDGGEIGRNGLGRTSLEVSDGQPRDAGLLG